MGKGVKNLGKKEKKNLGTSNAKKKYFYLKLAYLLIEIDFSWRGELR